MSQSLGASRTKSVRAWKTGRALQSLNGDIITVKRKSWQLGVSKRRQWGGGTPLIRLIRNCLSLPTQARNKVTHKHSAIVDHNPEQNPGKRGDWETFYTMRGSIGDFSFPFLSVIWIGDLRAFHILSSVSVFIDIFYAHAVKITTVSNKCPFSNAFRIIICFKWFCWSSTQISITTSGTFFFFYLIISSNQ